MPGWQEEKEDVGEYIVGKVKVISKTGKEAQATLFKIFPVVPNDTELENFHDMLVNQIDGVPGLKLVQNNRKKGLSSVKFDVGIMEKPVLHQVFLRVISNSHMGPYCNVEFRGL